MGESADCIRNHGTPRIGNGPPLTPTDGPNSPASPLHSTHHDDAKAREAEWCHIQGLNGCWMALAAHLDGVNLPGDILIDLSLNVHNGWFIFGDDEGVLAIDHHVRPAGLDVLAVRGPSRGRFVPAIFEHAGGMLRICYALTGTERPKEFRAPLGSRRLLVTYRKAGAAIQTLG
jgi:uncharacterized protein (TIGR03067 family)